MKAHTIKTDNACVADKIRLRQMATEGLKEIKVLDLFAGNNVLWGNFKLAKYYGIEMVKDKGKNLHADNMRVIPSLDLSEFNVIDCDSYGMPMPQIEALISNSTLQSGTIILYTAISNKMSQLTRRMKTYFGLNEMYKNAQTLFNGYAHAYFYEYLRRKLGVKKVVEFEKKGESFVKKYGYFVYI
jgi:hypothetical protein